MTNAELPFEVRDEDLPDHPALARAGDYSGAVGEVERLHAQFRDQVEAGGEGGSSSYQRLVVVELPDVDGGQPTSLFWSTSNGLRPRPVR